MVCGVVVNSGSVQQWRVILSLAHIFLGVKFSLIDFLRVKKLTLHNSAQQYSNNIPNWSNGMRAGW